MKLQDGLFVVLVVCAVVTTGLVVRRELAGGPPTATEPSYIGVSSWKSYAVGHRRGADVPAVIVTQFSDFQCPYCRVLNQGLDAVLAQYGSKVAVVYRHFPYDNHAFAEEAARASECAGEQGRFWGFHDALYSAQDQIGTRAWTEFGREAQVPDMESFGECLDRTAPFDGLVADAEAASALGVRGTPTFLINDRLYRGTLSPEALVSAVERALRGGE